MIGRDYAANELSTWRKRRGRASARWSRGVAELRQRSEIVLRANSTTPPGCGEREPVEAGGARSLHQRTRTFARSIHDRRGGAEDDRRDRPDRTCTTRARGTVAGRASWLRRDLRTRCAPPGERPNVSTDIREEHRIGPHSVAWATYRIRQESLTNAARHGGGSADLLVTSGSEALEITVTNPIASSRLLAAGTE